MRISLYIRIAVFLAIIFFVCNIKYAEAASITSAQTGLWSDTATWVGGTAPTGSDTVTISSGHIVTYDADLTHTQPITVSGTLKGSGARVLILNNTTMTVNAGGAITNTSGTFEIRIAGTHNQSPGSKITMSGTTGSHIAVTGESATNYIFFSTGGFIGGGQAEVDYTDFAYCGSSSGAIPCWKGYPRSGITFMFSFQNCTFDANTAYLSTTVGVGLSVNSIFQVEDSKFLATGENIQYPVAINAITTGTRSIQRNYFAGSLGNATNGGQFQDVTIKNNVIRGMLYLGTATRVLAELSYNLIQKQGSAVLTANFSTTPSQPNYLHYHSSSGQLTNPHVVYLLSGSDARISGWIFEPGNTDSAGDTILTTGTYSTARSFTVDHNIALPNSSGVHAGQFVSLLGASTLTIDVNHNTFFPSNNSGESGAISYGETYAGVAGILSAIKSNLVVMASGGTGGFVFQRRNIYTVSDGASASNVTHNGKYNLTTGDWGVGYDDQGNIAEGQAGAMFSTGSPGTSDVVADPQFVDDTRRISTWAVDRGYSSSETYQGRVDDAYTALQTSTGDRVEDLIDWVSAGYAPQNRSFRSTAHDGADIGAISWVDANSTSVSITAPTDGSTVSDTVSVTASASDTSGISGVKFYYDDTNLIGAEDTTSPYSVELDTTSLTTGTTHTLIAVATDIYSNPSTSSAITVTISNDPSVPPATQSTSGSASGRRHSLIANKNLSLAPDVLVRKALLQNQINELQMKILELISLIIESLRKNP